MKKDDAEAAMAASISVKPSTSPDGAKPDESAAASQAHALKSVVSRYYVKKHSWVSKYYRTFCLTSAGEVLTLNPATSEVTDRWRYDSVVSVQPDHRSSEEFSLVVRKANKANKTEKVTFSTALRPYLLTELLQAISHVSNEKKEDIAKNKILLRKARHNGELKDVIFAFVPWGLCQIERDVVVRTYLFHLLGRVLTVTDSPGAFVLEYGKACKCRYLFELRNESQLKDFLKLLKSTAKAGIGVTINFEKTSRKQAEEDAVVGNCNGVCSKEVNDPFNTLAEFRMYKVTFTRHRDPSLRVVSLTKHWIIERLSAHDRIVSLHKISYIDRVIINTQTPGSFVVCYKDGAKSFYACDSDAVRGSFVSYLLDCAAANGERNVSLVTEGPDRRLCIMPPGVPVDAGSEEQLLNSIATWDTSSTNTNFGLMLSVFNANIPYSGPKHIDEGTRLEKLAVKALESILRITNANALRTQTFAAIYRLLVLPVIFNVFVKSPPLQEKLLHLIKAALSTQINDSVLVYNMLNVVHLIVAPHLHMDLALIESYSSGRDSDNNSGSSSAAASAAEDAKTDKAGKAVDEELSEGSTSTSEGESDDDDGYSSNGEKEGAGGNDGGEGGESKNSDRKQQIGAMTPDDVMSAAYTDLMAEMSVLKEAGKRLFMNDDILIQLFLTSLSGYVLQGSASLTVLGWMNVFSALIFNNDGYSDTEKAVTDSLLDKIGMLGRGLFKLFSHTYPLSVTKSSLEVLTLLLQRKDFKFTASIKYKALCDGATLLYLRSLLFPNVSTMKTTIMSGVRRRLAKLLITDCSAALEMLKRIVPSGLVYFLMPREERATPSTSDSAPTAAAADSSKRDSENDPTTATAKEDTPKKRPRNSVEKKLLLGTEFFDGWNLGLRECFYDVKKPGPGELTWKRFLREFQRDHVRPDLVWNSNTRQELKESLDREIAAFQREQSLLQGKYVTWNHAEFTVNYESLRREVCVGGYYLQLLLDDRRVPAVRDPVGLYDLLYRRLLVERDCELQALCIQAVTTVYTCYKDTIGPFKDVEYIIMLLRYCNNYLVRDRILQLFRAVISASTPNAYAFTNSDGIPLLVDLLTLVHLHSCGNTSVASTCENEAPLKEWYYNDAGNSYPHTTSNSNDDAGGPLSICEMKRLYRTGVVTLHTLVWAQGMEGWDTVENVLPLRWALMGCGRGFFDETEYCECILDIFSKLCEAFPTRDEMGILIRPVSKPKQQLTSVRALPHLVQLLLARNARITSSTVGLLGVLLYENPQVIAQLYRTGFFYFALLQDARKLDSLFDLFKLTKLLHRYQAVCMPPSSSSAQADTHKRSVYDGALPEGLVCCLDTVSPNTYINIFMGIDQTASTTEIVWDSEMRNTLIRCIAEHLGNFPRRLAANPKAVYQYMPMAPVPYARSQSPSAQGYRIDDLFCYHYYINRIASPEDFTIKSNESPLEFLDDLNALLLSLSSSSSSSSSHCTPEFRSIIIRLQACLYIKCSKDVSLSKYPCYDILTEVLETADQDSPIVAAAAEIIHRSTQFSPPNAEVMEANGCLAALVKTFVGLGTRVPPKYTDNEKIVLNCASLTCRCTFETPKCGGYIEEHRAEITEAFLRLLHSYNFSERADFSSELITNFLVCISSFVTNRNILCEIVRIGLAYELVPILFKYNASSPLEPSAPVKEDRTPEKVNAQISYSVLKKISNRTEEAKEDAETQGQTLYTKEEAEQLAETANDFKKQMLTLFTDTTFEKLRLKTPQEFFSELARVDKDAVLSAIKTLTAKDKE